MLRNLSIWILLAPVLTAAIWPDQFGAFTKQGAQPVAVSDRAVWEEYGFEEGEQAEFGSGQESFRATAWRLKDPTGALAAFQWQRPEGAVPSELGKLAAEANGVTVLVFGNYLFRFEGRKPELPELATLFDRLPRLDQSALPALTDYLPTENLVPSSERFIIGPASLEKFEPRISPAVAGFHYGAEAQLGKFNSPGGQMGLAIFSYPTPHIARERLAEFQKLPGAMAKRSGPLVAIIFSPPDANAAERLLSRVRYTATLSWSEYIPSKRDNIGDLILTVFTLIGVLLLFALAGGLAVGGVRFLSRVWTGQSKSDEPMITLHLEDR